MTTIKEIKEKLSTETVWQSWMDELAKDERTGVQNALKSWQRAQEKQQKLVDEHQSKLAFDQSFRENNASLVAGTDEAGRGPLAGPVVTAAVILPNNACEALLGLNDSKQLSHDKREEFIEKIMQTAVATAVHFQSVEVIDDINIYEATRESMKASIEKLAVQPDYVLADAMKLDIEIAQSSIIKGDAKSLAIAAASILAKTARDHYMEDMDEQYPGYGFAKHAGYGTKQHLEALDHLGVTPIHRKTFEPIKTMLLKG